MTNPLTRFRPPIPARKAPEPDTTNSIPHTPWRTDPTAPVDPTTGNSTDRLVRTDGRRALAEVEAQRLRDYEQARDAARAKRPPLFPHHPTPGYGA